MFSANQWFIFCNFSFLLPLTEVSPKPSAIPGGNQPGDWQSTMGLGEEFEPGTAGKLPGVIPLSHHASLLSHHASLLSHHFSLLGHHEQKFALVVRLVCSLLPKTPFPRLTALLLHPLKKLSTGGGGGGVEVGCL
jgi:hypothetical protein